MGGRADRNLVAADQRDVLFEVHEPHRDLPLIVIHGLDRVEIAPLYTQEHGVGRERPFAENAARLGVGERGHDLCIVLMTKLPPSPAWGLSAATGDAGLWETRFAHAAIRQDQSVPNLLHGDEARDLRKRDMRGDAGVPQMIEHIDFAPRPAAQLRADDLDLVEKARLEEPRRMLVEGRESDRTRQSIAGELQRLAEIGEREAPACERAFARDQ